MGQLNDYTICFFLSVLFLLITVVCTVKYKEGLAGRIRILGVGIVLTNVILLLPLEGVANSILSGLQVGSLNASYRDVINELFHKMNECAPNALFQRMYSGFLTCLFVLSPLLVGGIAFSFFTGAMQRCKYFVCAFFMDIYFFSDLHEHSLMLANDISKRGRCMIVFFNVLSENPLYGDAMKSGYVLFATSGHDIICFGQGRRSFFEISKDMTDNLIGAQRLIKHFTHDSHKNRIRIFLFSNQDDAEILIDATEKHGISVSVINEPVSVAYNLLYDIPLYRALEVTGDNGLSVLIIGAGKIGSEIAKAVAWCGQMGSVPQEITVIDRDATFIERKFRLACPELMDGEYAVRFYTADAQTDQLEETLDKFGRNANYIVVCLSSDELNIRTAIYLRGYYLRADRSFRREPIICAQVSNEMRSINLRELAAVSKSRQIEKGLTSSASETQHYNIKPFGTYESIYSYGKIVQSPIESLAMNVNAVYSYVQNPKRGKSARELYNSGVCEVDKRSCRANAIHILYKLYILGFEIISSDKAGIAKTKDSVSSLEELRICLNNRALLDQLTEVEHCRWSAFQRSEGYRKATIEEADIYKAYTGSHINRRVKLHAGICPWTELHSVAEKYDQKMIWYDLELIRNIPAIVGAIKDPNLNLEDVCYSIKKRSGVCEIGQLPRVLP